MWKSEKMSRDARQLKLARQHLDKAYDAIAVVRKGKLRGSPLHRECSRIMTLLSATAAPLNDAQRIVWERAAER